MTRDALTDHFTWAEVVASNTALRLGIANEVPAELVPNVERMAAFMEEVRAAVGTPLRVTSWYRCPDLNRTIGGSKTSAHMKGLAVDFQPLGCSLAKAFDRIAASGLVFDQLIEERTKDGAAWIHIGLSTTPPRQEVLRARGKQVGGPMSYLRVAVG
jgi:zinc D-Ala-D-Ala carboxypeptidase